MIIFKASKVTNATTMKMAMWAPVSIFTSYKVIKGIMLLKPISLLIWTIPFLISSKAIFKNYAYNSVLVKEIALKDDGITVRINNKLVTDI